MKKLNEVSSKDLSAYSPSTKTWYIIQSSVYANNSFMLRKYEQNGYSETIAMGSACSVIERLDIIKESIAAEK